jgi:hypothetical protein
MATNNNPDLLYLKSREALLQYEDARLNSLLQAVANFYTTSNDQSIWGNFLRALAIELSKLDYDYSYDLVNKDPNLLTPADIRRRWAAPLYLTGNWPSQGQFDLAFKAMLVELITAYGQGTTVDAIQEVIFAYTGINIVVEQLYQQIGNGVYDQSDRNSIKVSVAVGGAGSNPLTTITTLAQLQVVVNSLYTAIALATPAHVGIEFTTVFGEAEDLECMISPSLLTQQQYAVEDTVTQGFYGLTGWVPINPGLTGWVPINPALFYSLIGWVPINPALFWIKNTVYVPGSLILDYNKNFQLATSVVGLGESGPGPAAPAWSTVSEHATADNQITWTNISPAVASTSLSANVVTVNLSFPVPLVIGSVVTLYNLGASAFLNGQALAVASISGSTFTANFVHPIYPTTPEATGTATFALPTPINNIQYQALTPQWQSLYQQQYKNTNCTSAGIGDTLRIFVQQVERPPLNDMLVVAPVLSPTNANTSIAAWGDTLNRQVTPAQWATMPRIFVNIASAYADGKNATYMYVPTSDPVTGNIQFLHEGELVTVNAFNSGPSLGFNVTAKIRNVINTVAQITATAVQTNVLTVTTVSNTLVTGSLVNIAGLSASAFLNGLSFVVVTAGPTFFTAAYTHANYASTPDNGTAEVTSFQIPATGTTALTSAPLPLRGGLVTPVPQAGYYLSGGVYVLGQPPLGISITPPAGQPYSGESWVPGGTVFQGQIVVDSNGYTQLALQPGVSQASPNPSWSEDKNASTTDGSVIWRNVGRNTFTAPQNWIAIWNINAPGPRQSSYDFSVWTGEIGNWDSTQPYGLLAPRLDRVWEISGGDQSFIFGLF